MHTLCPDEALSCITVFIGPGLRRDEAYGWKVKRSTPFVAILPQVIPVLMVQRIFILCSATFSATH